MYMFYTVQLILDMPEIKYAIQNINHILQIGSILTRPQVILMQ